MKGVQKGFMKKMIIALMFMSVLFLPFISSAQIADETFNVNPVYQPVYSITLVGITPVTTDLVTLQGSASKTIAIKHVLVSGKSTSGGASCDVSIMKRTAADSGGTKGTTPVITQFDSTDAAPTATPAYYTAAPTVGTGTVIEDRILNKGAAGSAGLIDVTFSNRNDKQLKLHGTSEFMALYFNSATVTTGDLVSVTIEFEEF